MFFSMVALLDHVGPVRSESSRRDEVDNESETLSSKIKHPEEIFEEPRKADRSADQWIFGWANPIRLEKGIKGALRGC